MITTDEIINRGTTNTALDPKKIEQSIIVAEERFIRPLMGYDFYRAFVDSKNLVITSGNKSAQQTLITNSYPAGSQDVVLNAGDIVNAYEYLSAENQTLWLEHLWQLCTECVLLMAFPDNYIQFGSQGVHLNAPPAGPMTTTGIVSPDLRSVKWAMDKKLQDRIDPLRESMHLWLCKQQKADSTKYILYEKTCDCDVDGVAYKRKTDVVMGIYDDIDNPYPDSCCE